MIWGVENIQSAVGIPAILAISWAFSRDRSQFPWKLALGVLCFQILLALILFGVPFVRSGLMSLTDAVQGLKEATQVGTAFVFGPAGGGDTPYTTVNHGIAPSFAFQILPFVIFLSALSALLWHWRILQWVTRGMAAVFERLMGLAGATAVAIAAKVFLGMIEAPLLIRPYLPQLARQDLYVVMTAGFATTAGTVLFLYSAMLEPYLPGATAHLITASLLSAPGAVLIGRIIMPLRAETKPEALAPTAKRYNSSMDAFTTGTSDGLKLYLSIIAMLIASLAFVALVNMIFSAVLPDVFGAPLTMERIFGWFFMPLAWLIGVPVADIGRASELLAIKTVLNEFIAYVELSQIPHGEITERTRVLMTYALCGFANFGAVGTMLAGLTVLIPDRRADILAFGIPAMFSGMLATLLTASIIGALPQVLFAP